MKHSDIVKTGFVIVLSCAVIALLQRIPRDSNTVPAEGDALLKTIRRDPPPSAGKPAATLPIKNGERKPAVPASGVIKLSDETFAPGYDEIYDNREKYYGREISVSGYVETGKLPAGQFLVGRDLLWCCQNDKYFIGFLVMTDGKCPEENAELRVTGVFEAVSYTDPDTGKSFLVPAIRAEKIEPAPKFSREVFPG